MSDEERNYQEQSVSHASEDPLPEEATPVSDEERNSGDENVPHAHGNPSSALSMSEGERNLQQKNVPQIPEDQSPEAVSMSDDINSQGQASPYASEDPLAEALSLSDGERNLQSNIPRTSDNKLPEALSMSDYRNSQQDSLPHFSEDQLPKVLSMFDRERNLEDIPQTSKDSLPGAPLSISESAQSESPKQEAAVGAIRRPFRFAKAHRWSISGDTSPPLPPVDLTKDPDYDLNKQAKLLDRKRLYEGKMDVFRRFFDQEDIDFFTLPEARKRHQAERRRFFSEGCRSRFESGPSSDHPMNRLTDTSIPMKYTLNQAGAIVGSNLGDTIMDHLVGNTAGVYNDRHLDEEAEHSYGSADTAPIADVYAGNFPSHSSPPYSSRGMSSGSSFPSFPSNPSEMSDCPSPEGDRQDSPVSLSSENLPPPPEKPVRKRRFGVSQPISVPTRSKSALAGSIVDNAEQSSASHASVQRKTSADYSVCSEPASARKISKDSSVDSSERMSSEDEGVHYPELSHSLESDLCMPMRDVSEGGAENLHERFDALRISAVMASAEVPQQQQPVVSQNPEQETEDSESEQDPVSVLSCSPDASKNSEHPDE